LSSCINKYQKVNKQKSPPRIIKSLPSRKIYSMISNENQEEDKNEEDEGMIISPKKKKKKKKKEKLKLMKLIQYSKTKSESFCKTITIYIL